MLHGFFILIALSLVTPPLFAEDPSEKDLKTLVESLGHENFRERKLAEKTLNGYSRNIVPALRKHEEARDPEVRLRVRRVIKQMMADPEKIPSNVFILDADGLTTSTYKTGMGSWNSNKTVAAQMDVGRSGTSGGFAQSMVPETDTIAAIELATYPIGNGTGWLMADLRPDHNGAPSAEVLARAWIRVGKTLSLHGVSLVYDIPDVRVQKGATYWIVFRPFNDAGPKSAIMNFGLNTSSTYSNGVLWRDSSSQPSTSSDAKFSIISKCFPPPFLKKAEEKDLKTLPSAEVKWEKKRP